MNPKEIIMGSNNYKMLITLFSENESKNLTNGRQKSVIHNNVSLNGPILSKKYSIIEIESLHKKYFRKTLKDAIVVIAILLNIINIYNKYYKTRMYK